MLGRLFNVSERLIGLTVETPPPTDVRRQHSAEQRTDHARDSHRGSHGAHPCRSLFQREGIDHQYHTSTHHACGSHALYRPSNNEGDRVGRRAADRRSNLKNNNKRQVDVFRAVESVNAAEKEAAAARREQECPAVPTDVV